MARAYSSWIERSRAAVIVGVCLFAGSCAGSVVEHGREQQLEDARAVLVQVEQLLDEEQLLGECPIEGILEDRSLGGLAEEQGALMCFSESSSELPEVTVGATLPDDFILSLDQVGESVDVGLGAVTVRCGEGMCIGLWAAEEIAVFVVVFASGSHEMARALVTESIGPVVNWVSDFDLELLTH